MVMPQHKIKTHRGFDLLRSQTVQKEMRLHENGSFRCARLARVNFNGSWIHFQLVRLTPRIYSPTITHSVVFNVHEDTLVTLIRLACDC